MNVSLLTKFSYVLKFIYKNDPLLVFVAPLILVIGLLIKLFFGVDAIDPERWTSFAFLQDWPAWPGYLLSTALALVSAFVINQLVQKLGLFGRISNMTMLVFALLYFTIPLDINAFPAWIVVLMQLTMLRWVLMIFEHPGKAGFLVFNAGVVIGLLSLFVNGALLLLLLPAQALFATRESGWRNMVFALLGWVTPIYLINAMAYLLSQPQIWPKVQLELTLLTTAMDKLTIIGLAFLLFMALVAAYSVFAVASSTTMRERRRWMLMISYLAVGGTLILNAGFTESVFVAFVPATIVMAKVLATIKNVKLGNLLFILFIAFILLINS